MRPPQPGLSGNLLWCLPLSRTQIRFPFRELSGIGGLRLLRSEGTQKIQPPLTYPRPTFLQDRDQDVGGTEQQGVALPSSFPLHLPLFSLNWFFYFCISY